MLWLDTWDEDVYCQGEHFVWYALCNIFLMTYRPQKLSSGRRQGNRRTWASSLSERAGMSLQERRHQAKHRLSYRDSYLLGRAQIPSVCASCFIWFLSLTVLTVTRHIYISHVFTYICIEPLYMLPRTPSHESSGMASPFGSSSLSKTHVGSRRRDLRSFVQNDFTLSRDLFLRYYMCGAIWRAWIWITLVVNACHSVSIFARKKIVFCVVFRCFVWSMSPLWRAGR